MTWSVAPLLDRSVTQAAKFGELTVWDHYSLLLKRGHTGPVICVAASKEVDFIVSGGCDYTVRIWRYDAHSTSYMFHGEVVHPNPAPAPVPVTTGFFNVRRFMTDVRDKGVTAVAVAGSRVATLVEGDEVRLE